MERVARDWSQRGDHAKDYLKTSSLIAEGRHSFAKLQKQHKELCVFFHVSGMPECFLAFLPKSKMSDAMSGRMFINGFGKTKISSLESVMN